METEYEWFVVMYRYNENDRKLPGREEHRLGPFASERIADKADRGVNINLDHERFYTGVVKKARRRKP